MKNPILNPIRCALACIVLQAIWITPAPAAIEPEADPEPAPAPRDEPAWISRAHKEDVAPAGSYRPAALRSIGALLLIIGALMMTHHWLRRRFSAEQPSAGSRLKILSRLRLGARQELVVIEWDGDQVMLGMGPSYIRPLHTRHHREPEPGQTDLPALEETSYASR